MVKDNSNGSNWQQVRYRAFIQNSKLSVRAIRVLLSKTADLEEFLLLSAKDIMEFITLRNCGRATVLELLKFQNELHKKLDIYPLQEASKANPDVDIHDFRVILNDANLSIRATNVIMRNVPTLQKFIELNESDIIKFKNCGKKTTCEIIKFRSILAEKPELIIHKKPQATITMGSPSSSTIDRYNFLFAEIKLLLSERARNVLESHNINTLHHFMTLSISKMKRMKNCGIRCIKEYTTYQDNMRKLFEKVNEESKLAGDSEHYYDLSPSKVYKLFDNIFMAGYGQIDTENPSPSLKRWISEIYPKSENGQRAFMLRMGMLGNVPMTLVEISGKFGKFSRQHIQQIVEKVESIAKYHLHQRRLIPLIKKIADFVTTQGGEVEILSLVSHVLARGEEGENLKYATGFIKFLNSLEAWHKMGLRIFGDKIILFPDIVKPLSLVIGDLAYQYAEEKVSDQLWSISLCVLQGVATNWANQTYPQKQLQSIPEAMIEESISLSPVGIKQVQDRVYSKNLWLLTYGKASEAIEYILDASQKPMHFAEVLSKLNQYRDSEKSFSGNYVHKSLLDNNNLLLWDRGTFIHRHYVQIPYILINDIEKWSIGQLRKGAPFISAYGAFKAFESRCLAERVPNETALYYMLRELSHPLLAYPKIPYIYLDNGKLEKLSIATVIEQFIQDHGGPVNHDDLETFALQKLYLKDFQFDTIKYALPNVIRTDDGSFLHTDCLDIDMKKLHEIIKYIQRLLNYDEHIPITRVFSNKRICCKMIGIDGPIALFSLLQLFAEDEFDFRRYPQIWRLSLDDNHKNRGLHTEIAEYIKKKGRPCSYQEIQEVFVEKLGYNLQTVYNIRYKNGIFNYLRDYLVHIDTIGWNEVYQDILEETARQRYSERLKTGKPYGLVSSMIEFENLPHLDRELYWTPYLLADILVRRDNFRLLGNKKNAYVPVPNQSGIRTFEDLVYELLKREFDGGTNIIEFTHYLRNCDIIIKSLTKDMLGDSGKVRIMGKEIVIEEFLGDA